ncbi:MAG: glycosyltransferase N-terminal domain-containing protein [Flavobacteriales bacterium]
MPLLYDIATGLYHTAIRAAAPFKPKAKQWADGRRGQWERLEAKRELLKGCLWMHCASVGEFEQGRPVLEAIKRERPHLPVLLTFFSPSGYEAHKLLGSVRSDSSVTHVDYLPLDNARNARRLVRLLEPKAAIFIKYEFWYHHLHALKDAGVPTYLVSAIFRKGQPFFLWYGMLWRGMLQCYTRIFTQDEASRDLLAGIGVTNVSLSGDTRFDRVAAIAQEREVVPIAEAFTGDRTVIVCGSTWPEDEALLLEAFALLAQQPKLIVAPHEMDSAQLQKVEQRFPKPLVRWSELENTDHANISATLGKERSGTLLVDRMGLLARLYQHGTIAYVGGGFGDGIHSLLEAAAWGKPVIFGPRHTKFVEAKGLMECGAGFEVRDADDLRQVLEHLADGKTLLKASGAARQYVQDHAGATHKVVAAIKGGL